MSRMNINDIFEAVQGFDLFDLGTLLTKLEQGGHSLTQTEITALAAAAAAGLLLCLFGLKIVRLWAALMGLAAGFFIGITAAQALGADSTVCTITGIVTGLILAGLGASLYRAGVFITVMISISLFCIHMFSPRDWLPLAGCLAAGIAAAGLSIKFLEIVTIFATSLLGAITAGPALCYLLPDTGMDGMVRIILCTVFGALGVLVQLLLESRKRKKQNLKKAAEIQKEASTANEVERARAVINEIDRSSSDKETAHSSTSASESIPHGEGLETISLNDIEDIDEPDEQSDKKNNTLE